MRRMFTGLLGIFVYFSCVQRDSIKRVEYSIEDKILDTIYYTRPNQDLSHVTPIIKLRGDVNNGKVFSLRYDTLNFLKISVIPYENYPVHILNTVNIIIKESNVETGEYYLVPTDSVCSFDVYVDFGKGNAVIKYFSNNESNYIVEEAEGMYIIGKVTELVVK